MKFSPSIFSMFYTFKCEHFPFQTGQAMRMTRKLDTTSKDSALFEFKIFSLAKEIST
jgi:hypothetical protein